MRRFTEQQLKYYAIIAFVLSFIVGAFFFLDLVFLDEVFRGGGPKEILLGASLITGAAGLLFLFFLIKWRFTTYSVSEDAIVLKKFLYRKTFEIRTVNIQVVETRQNPLQKILRIESILIEGLNNFNKQELLIIVANDKEVEGIKRVIQSVVTI